MLKPIKLLILPAMLLALACCQKDDLIKPINGTEEDFTTITEEMKKVLNDTIVLSTTATKDNIDKTLLKEGCPVRYKFEWAKGEDKKEHLVFRLLDFKIGEMPFGVYFICETDLFYPNDVDKKKLEAFGAPMDAWVKIVGKQGVSYLFEGALEEAKKSGGGGVVEGYYNYKTHQASFYVNYNTMNVESNAYMQTIDLTRKARFEKEFKAFSEAFEKEKERRAHMQNP